MGALSSWAMLALSHHVIVQMAALRAGWKGWFPLYALLGDDIVILREDVAREYLSLMRYLGVPINMSKTISSQVGLIEFAKRVVSAHHGDLSPVSGRLLVAAVRRPEGYPDLWTHILDLGYILFPNQLLKVMANLSSDIVRKPFTALKIPNVGKAMIARVLILSRYREGVVLRPPLPVDEWFLILLGSAALAPRMELEAKLRRIWETRNSAGAERRRAWNQAVVFTTQWWRYSLFSGTLGGILSIPLLILSPAYWVSMTAQWTAVRKLWWANVLGVMIAWGIGARVLEPNAELYNISAEDVDLKRPDIPALQIERPPKPNVGDGITFWGNVISDVLAREESRRCGAPNRVSQTIVGVSGLLAAPAPPS
jgi:hypothetical protein